MTKVDIATFQLLCAETNLEREVNKERESEGGEREREREGERERERVGECCYSPT